MIFAYLIPNAEGCTDNINHCVLNPYKLYKTCVNTAFDTLRTTSVTNCISNNQDNGGIQTSDTFCRNIDRAVCTHIGRFANPFHELCYLNSTNGLYATRRYTIFNNCIGGTLRGQTCKVVIACRANPFGSECPDDALFNDAKETYCRANSTDLCNPTVERICTANALDDLCTGDSRYDTPRIMACREDQSDNKCVKIIKDVCDVTPLDTLCAEDNSYTDARQTACRAADLTTETRCGTAIMQICDANLRDPICDKDARYQDTHRDACRQSLNDQMCTDTITRACDINALDRLCTGDNRYIPAQITHCNQPANTGSPDCQHFATTTPCLENPFLEGGQCDAAFDNLDSAKQSRFDYCNGESPIASLCTGAQTICEQSENLFATKCDAFNTTARVDYCATGSNTLMGDTMQTDPKCTDTNIPAQSCVSNPFADICTTILTDAETIRQGRVSYCHTLTRAEIRGSYLCSSLDIICRESPFENVLYRCLKHSAWAGYRDHQVSTCRADETRQATACTNFIQYCFQNPFDTANQGFCKDPAFNQEREARVLSCYNGRFIGSACDALAPCSNAPFSTTLMLNERTCNTAPEFAAIRTMKAENCNGADFANFPCDNVRAALCTDSNTDNYLFSPLCNRADNPYHQVRKNLIQACQNNSNLQGCTETILLCLRKGGYETDTTCVNSAFNSHRDGQTSQCTAAYRDSGSIHEDDISCIAIDTALCTDTGPYANPFHDICRLTGVDYSAERTAIFNGCRDGMLSGTVCEPVTFCMTYPFGSDCRSDPLFETARETYCRANSNTTCNSIVERLCTADVLDDICADDTRYSDAHETACRGTPTDSRCAGVIAQLCDAEALDDICASDSRYSDAHETACRGAPEDSRCTDVITQICDTSPLDDLCTGDSRYETPRIAACREDQSDKKCKKIVKDVCDASPLDTLCADDNRYKNARQTACRAADLTTETRCGEAIMQICDANLRDEICDKDDRYQTQHRAACRQTANNPQCATTITTICTGDPFDSACISNPLYHRARLIDCITADNTRESRCTAMTTEATCFQNPFASGCEHHSLLGDVVDLARKARVAFCNDNSHDLLCIGINIERICAYDPFGANCLYGGIYDTARATKITECSWKAKQYSGDCAGTLARPNFATWTQGFANDLPASPVTDPYGDAYNQFLRGTANGLNTGDFTPIGGVKTLNLRDATYKGKALGGDVSSGVAFFRASGSYTYELDLSLVNATSIFTYAGILSGTNLGEPLSQTWGHAVWNGQIRVDHASGKYLNTDLELSINYSEKSIYAFVHAPQRGNSSQYYLLQGNYNDVGLITGTVLYDDFINHDPKVPTSNVQYTEPGILTGLIGQKGAVGAFISDTFYSETNTDYHKHNYSGGFVVCPAGGCE